MKSFTIKIATGGIALSATSYIDWPAPCWLPGLRWWPVALWAWACVMDASIRDAIQDPDDSYDTATLDDD